MKGIKRICLLLAGSCILAMTGCGSAAQPPAPEREAIDYTQGFLSAEETDTLTRIDENDRFILYANFSNGEMAIEDKQEDRTWYSNPVDKNEDGLASGYNKNALLSVITVNYSTDQSVAMTCGGYMSSVSKDGLSYRLSEDGSVVFLFDFPNEEFKIPIQYSLTESGFAARILADGIEEYGDNTVCSINFLPFFGAGGVNSEGYMLIPDGSGALIYYNNGKTAAAAYSQTMYGFDNGTTDRVGDEKSTKDRKEQQESTNIVAKNATTPAFSVSQSQYLPVFGVNQDGGGFLAEITGGDGRTAINANVAGKNTLYNTVWTTYTYRTIASVRQAQKDGSVKGVDIAEKNKEIWQDYTVEFCFLEDGSAEYADMAALYRSRLLERGDLTKQTEDTGDIPFYLELYGYLVKTKSFMGIPRQTKISLTTVEDANTILDAASEAGIDKVALKYEYWMKNSYYDKLAVSGRVEGKVGDEKEMLALQERLEAQGGGLYPASDLLNVYELGNGVGKYQDVLLSAANTAQMQYQFNLDSGTVDSRYAPWYLLRPSALTEFFTKLTDNLGKRGYHNLALDAIGEMCYSELGSSGMGRNQAVSAFAETVREASEAAGTLMLTGANGYAAVYAGHILETPARNSGYDIEDVSVPFYQMVFHGYISYSLSATNLASDPADITLKSLEYGASPLYQLVVENVDELIGSRTDGLYSADYGNWKDYMGRQYAQLNETLGLVQGQTIVSHTICTEDVRRVDYENGVIVYVNYGESDAEADGISIPARGYAAVLDGRILTQGRAAEYGEGSGY